MTPEEIEKAKDRWFGDSAGLVDEMTALADMLGATAASLRLPPGGKPDASAAFDCAAEDIRAVLCGVWQPAQESGWAGAGVRRGWKRWLRRLAGAR